MTLPSYQTLGDTFAALLSEALSPAEMAEVRRVNALSHPYNCCASGDFCDANMIMDAAFLAFGIETLPDIEAGMSDALESLWNAAWTYAKANHLTAKV